MPSLRGDGGVSDWWQNSKTLRLSLLINSKPSGGGDGGFSVSLRPALMHWYTSGHAGHPISIYDHEAIHGKTGPAPSGVNKKKGVKI